MTLTSELELLGKKKINICYCSRQTVDVFDYEGFRAEKAPHFRVLSVSM